MRLCGNGKEDAMGFADDSRQDDDLERELEKSTRGLNDWMRARFPETFGVEKS